MRPSLTARAIVALAVAGRVPAWAYGPQPVRPPAKQAKPQKPEANNKNGPKVLGPAAVEQLRHMSPEERQRFLNSLPPARRQRLQERLNQYEQIPPAQRQRLEKTYEKFQQLPPEKQDLMRQGFRGFSQLLAGPAPGVAGRDAKPSLTQPGRAQKAGEQRRLQEPLQPRRAPDHGPDDAVGSEQIRRGRSRRVTMRDSTLLCPCVCSTRSASASRSSRLSTAARYACTPADPRFIISPTSAICAHLRSRTCCGAGWPRMDGRWTT